MSLKVLVTEKVTKDMLTKVVSLLSSTSAGLSAEKIDELVSAHLATHRGFTYAANNDLGMCVARMLDNCVFAGVTTADALEQQYATLRAEDPIANETIELLAHGIATNLSPLLHELRHILPQQTAELVAEINGRLPPELQDGGSRQLRLFNWGKLADPQHRAAAMLFAKDRAPCFKSDAAKYYDTLNIQRILPHGDTKAIAGAETLRPLLAAAITAAVEQEIPDAAGRAGLLAHKTLALDLLFNPRVYQQTITAAANSLSSKDLAASVIAVTDKIDAVEDLLRTVTASTLTQVNSTTHLSTDQLMTNLELVFGNIQLLRAAMIYPKDDALQSRLLLAPAVVQEAAFEAFRAEGGTEEMVQDYLTYMTLNPAMTLTAHGETAESIRAIHDKAHAAVVKNSTKLQSLAAATKMHALQETLYYTLETNYQTALKNGTYSHKQLHIHEQQTRRAMAILPQKALDDIALEYLVSMKDHPLTTALYKAINAELITLVKTTTEVTPPDVAQATCSAVTSTLLDMLLTRFAPAKAA